LLFILTFGLTLTKNNCLYGEIAYVQGEHGQTMGESGNADCKTVSAPGEKDQKLLHDSFPLFKSGVPRLWNGVPRTQNQIPPSYQDFPRLYYNFPRLWERFYHAIMRIVHAR
jgi:hypothetical protein